MASKGADSEEKMMQRMFILIPSGNLLPMLVDECPQANSLFIYIGHFSHKLVKGKKKNIRKKRSFSSKTFSDCPEGSDGGDKPVPFDFCTAQICPSLPPRTLRPLPLRPCLFSLLQR